MIDLSDFESLTAQIQQTTSPCAPGDLFIKVHQHLTSLEEMLLQTHQELTALYGQHYFPELVSIPLTSLEYARVVLSLPLYEKYIVKETDNKTRVIGWTTEDLNRANLRSFLNPSTAIVVAMAASTTKPQLLNNDKVSTDNSSTNLVLSIKDMAQKILDLTTFRTTLLSFIEQEMTRIAPNLTAIVGTRIASQLVASTGSIVLLSRVPAGNVQAIGASSLTKKEHGNFLTLRHVGYLRECDLVRDTDTELKPKAVRLVAAKVALAARLDASTRIDSLSSNHTNSKGRAWRQQIIEALERAAEPVKARLDPKPLPPPDAQPRRKRGGKRYRKQKALLTMTKARRAANRVPFGGQEEEIVVGDKVVGMGMLQTNGTGRVALLNDESGLYAREKLKRDAQAKITIGSKPGRPGNQNVFKNPFASKHQF